MVRKARPRKNLSEEDRRIAKRKGSIVALILVGVGVVVWLISR